MMLMFIMLHTNEAFSIFPNNPMIKKSKRFLKRSRIYYNNNIIIVKDHHARAMTSSSTGHENNDVVISENEKVETITKATSDVTTKFNTTLQFSPYRTLMECQPGEYVTSERFSVPAFHQDSCVDFNFCVKLYPRGCDSNNGDQISSEQNNKASNVKNMNKSKRNGFFGIFNNNNINNKKERVGVYLQYIPSDNNNNNNIALDMTFGLTLLGKQQQNSPQRRFNLEWRSGMRFVPLSFSKVMDGNVNDFGSYLMQTQLLSSFVGINETNYWTNNNPIEIDVDLIIHNIINTTATSNNNNDFEVSNHNKLKAFQELITPRDLRTASTTKTSNNSIVQYNNHNPEELRAGRIVVPLISELSQRPNMFMNGVYPGVAYRILRIIDPNTNVDIFYSMPNADYILKPIYPLVPQLERQWPVRINEHDIPRLATPLMYNIISAIGSLVASITALSTAFIISQAISFYYIPSRSMEPTLQIGDVLLVEKVTPRLEQIFSGKNFRKGDVILFTPPQQLIDIVSQSGGRLNSRDLFVKRIAGVQGDTFKVVAADQTKPGSSRSSIRINDKAPKEQRDLCTAEPLQLLQKYYLHPTENNVIIEPGTVVVLGDCSDVSIDSRVWGPLPIDNIVGRPIGRLWPFSRFGPVPSLSSSSSSSLQPSIPRTSTNINFWKD